jgi:hypothetical protein
MTWMLLVSVAAAFFLPKAMDGLSEDERRSLEEQMKTTNPTSMLKDLMGGDTRTDGAGGRGGGSEGQKGGSRRKKIQSGGEGKKQS